MNRFTGCLILLASLLCWSACAPEDPVVEGDDDKEVVRPPWLDEDEKDDDDSDPAPVPGP